MKMTFADEQQNINESWSKFHRPKNPKKQRKHMWCPKCFKKAFKIKMDYLGNKHETWQIARYNIDFYKCPRCEYVHREWSRIEGKGKCGTDLGRMYGSK